MFLSPISPHPAGHFPNENLHALLVLDQTLPTSIPLLWPRGGIASHFFESLREEGLLSKEREFVFIGNRHERSYYRARRMYFFRSSRSWGQSPFISWYGHRLVQKWLQPVLARRTHGATEEDAKKSVVVMMRHGTRSLSNHGELMRRLGEWLPGVSVDAFVPGPGSGHPMWDTAERIYKSCLLIGPHGGNMPNEMFMRSGCWVIEVGFIDAGFALPTDFYCFARNLGQTYWLSIGSGNYGSELTADLDDIGEIVHAYKKEVLGM